MTATFPSELVTEARRLLGDGGSSSEQLEESWRRLCAARRALVGDLDAVIVALADRLVTRGRYPKPAPADSDRAEEGK